MSNNHIHAYRRSKLGASTIYKCSLPDCPHFIQKSLVENRKCICSRCGFPFIITRRTLKNCPAKPHCEQCYSSTNVEKKLDDLIETLIVE